MHGHFHACFLGDGDNLLEEVLQIVPLILFGDNAVFGERFVTERFVMDAAGRAMGYLIV